MKQRGNRKIGIWIPQLTAVLMALFWILPCTVYAEEPQRTEIAVEQVSAEPGERVEVQVQVKNNPGILGASLKVAFGSSLKLMAAENGDAFAALSMTAPGRFASGCTFVWYGEKITDQQVQNGTILKLWFLVLEDAVPGVTETIAISYQNGDIFDAALQPVSCHLKNGGVSIVQRGNGIQCTSVLSVGDKIYAEYQSTSDAADVTVLLAAYFDNGQLASCGIKREHFSLGKNVLEFPNVETSLKYKVFTVQENTPLCAMKEAVRAFTVIFQDHDGTVLSTQRVPAGTDAVPPESPTRDGYVFAGWKGAYQNVWADSIVIAEYKEDAQPGIIVGSTVAAPGDAGAVIQLKVRNNPGILGMSLKVSYPSEAIELIDSENGAVLSKLTFTRPGKYRSGCVFTWYAEQIQAEDIKDGEILTLTFRILDGTPSGEYPIEVSFAEGDIFDGDLQYLTLTLEHGSIRVQS